MYYTSAYICITIKTNDMKITNNPEKEITKIILGYTDEVTSCDCCGKVDLKGTYAIDLNGDISYYGSVCAFKIQGVTFEEQKEVKKAYVKRMKAEEKFKELETEYNANFKTDYKLVKMLRFVENKKLDLKSFILKYGKLIDENIYYKAYAIGHIVKTIQK